MGKRTGNEIKNLPFLAFLARGQHLVLKKWNIVAIFELHVK